MDVSMLYGRKNQADLFNETFRANDVKSSTLLNELNGDGVLEVLLGDVLPDGPGHAPDVLEPVADVFAGSRQTREAGQATLDLEVQGVG